MINYVSSRMINCITCHKLLWLYVLWQLKTKRALFKPCDRNAWIVFRSHLARVASAPSAAPVNTSAFPAEVILPKAETPCVSLFVTLFSSTERCAIGTFLTVL